MTSNSTMIKVSSLVVALLILPTMLLAEVTSRPCPHSCDTMRLDRRHCKDWREGNTCFVDDLRAPSRPVDDASLQREIKMVNKDIRAGKTLKVSLPKKASIARLDVVVKRTGGSDQTSLNASLGGSIVLGTKGVNQNSNQVVQFNANGARPDGRKLELTASNGDLYVESVHILTR